MAKDTVTVTDNVTGKTIELPIYHGTHGPGAVDIKAFFAVVYSASLLNASAPKKAITCMMRIVTTNAHGGKSNSALP